MKELNSKNNNELTMKDLETVSGGGKFEVHVSDFPDAVCPMCKTKGMDSAHEYINGKRTELMLCNYCYYAFYHNEAGELVQFGRILG